MLDPIIQNFQHNESMLCGDEFFVKETINANNEPI
jgi:predicted ATPase